MYILFYIYIRPPYLHILPSWSVTPAESLNVPWQFERYSNFAVFGVISDSKQCQKCLWPFGDDRHTTMAVCSMTVGKLSVTVLFLWEVQPLSFTVNSMTVSSLSVAVFAFVRLSTVTVYRLTVGHVSVTACSDFHGYFVACLWLCVMWFPWLTFPRWFSWFVQKGQTDAKLCDLRKLTQITLKVPKYCRPVRKLWNWQDASATTCLWVKAGCEKMIMKLLMCFYRFIHRANFEFLKTCRVSYRGIYIFIHQHIFIHPPVPLRLSLLYCFCDSSGQELWVSFKWIWNLPI